MKISTVLTVFYLTDPKCLLNPVDLILKTIIMAKREQMLRLMYISDYLKSKGKVGANYSEIRDHLERKYYDMGFDNELAFSEKTFKRDRTLLSELFGIEIQFKRSTMTYRFIEQDSPEHSQGIFDSLMLINSYKLTADHSKIMLFEKRKSAGLDNLEGLIYAIKNNKTVSLQYAKFWDHEEERRVVQPYALKEFRYRWYLLAMDAGQENGQIKSFGLDRISDLEIHNKTFKRTDHDFEAMYQNAFGIVTSTQNPQKIILSFSRNQGRFVKSLPIHHSQQVVTDNDDELQIELFLTPTYDFYQELMTHFERVKILEPENVRDQYIKCLETAMQLNLSDNEINGLQKNYKSR